MRGLFAALTVMFALAACGEAPLSAVPTPSPSGYPASDLQSASPGSVQAAPPSTTATPTVVVVVPTDAPTASPPPPAGTHCQTGWTLTSGACYPPGSEALWTAVDCTWAEKLLQWDYSLDIQEANAVATGQDTRWGTGPDVIAYYRNYANDWNTVLTQVRGQCASPATPITATAATASIAWFSAAIAAHSADRISPPQWGRDWIGYYERLTTMFQSLS